MYQQVVSDISCVVFLSFNSFPLPLYFFPSLSHPFSSFSSSAELGPKSWQPVTPRPLRLPGKKVMGPTPKRTHALSTHRAAGSFDPVAPAQVSWRLVRKFIGTTGRGLCLFSSFNEEGDRLSGASISPKKHKQRKLLLLPDVSLSLVTPKESERERERGRARGREGLSTIEGELVVGCRIS